MTDVDKGMNPLDFESDPASTRIRINPEIADYFWLKLDATRWQLGTQ